MVADLDASAAATTGHALLLPQVLQIPACPVKKGFRGKLVVFLGNFPRPHAQTYAFLFQKETPRQKMWTLEEIFYSRFTPTLVILDTLLSYQSCSGLGFLPACEVTSSTAS